MSGEPAIDIPSIRVAHSPSCLSRQAAAVALALLTAAAALVVARRLAGALLIPLTPASLVAASCLASASAVAVRAGWLHRTPASSFFSWLDRVAMIWTSAVAVSLVVGLCLPGTPIAGVIAAGIVLSAEESWAWLWLRIRGRESLSVLPASVVSHAGAPACETNILEAYSEESYSEDIVQQLTRRCAADGSEELSGWLRVPVLPGQRTASAHVAFCPPFCATPEVAVEQLDGPESRIKMGQRLPYGARIDLKLASPAEEAASVLLQFSACSEKRG